MAEGQGRRNGMHHACAERNLGLIGLFLSYRLSLTSPRDENGETPLDILLNRAYDKTDSSRRKRAECLRALKIPDTVADHNDFSAPCKGEDDEASKGPMNKLLNKSPELEDAHKLINPDSLNWNRLGQELKIPFNDREELKTKCHTNSERLEAVLYKWIQSQSVPVTWARLMKALDEIKLKRVEQNIKRFLKTDEALEKYSSLPDWTT